MLTVTGYVPCHSAPCLWYPTTPTLISLSPAPALNVSGYQLYIILMFHICFRFINSMLTFTGYVPYSSASCLRFPVSLTPVSLSPASALYVSGYQLTVSTTTSTTAVWLWFPIWAQPRGTDAAESHNAPTHPTSGSIWQLFYRSSWGRKYTTIIWASLWENRSSGFPTRSDTNRAVQPHKIARDFKFRIQKVEGMYYLCSENKGADQWSASLFSHMRNAGFLTTRLKRFWTDRSGQSM